VQNATNFINTLRNEIREMDSENERRRIQTGRVKEEINGLMACAVCAICRKELYEWVLNCGHLICESCRCRISDRCHRCGEGIPMDGIFRLRYN
jgi:hypothetical protein